MTEQTDEEKILYIKKRALKLAIEGKLKEAIDSVVEMHGLQLLAKNSTFSTGMMFIPEESAIANAKKRVSEFVEKKEFNETTILQLIAELFDNLDQDLRITSKMGYILGMADMLKDDFYLKQKQVEDWIERFGEPPLFIKDRSN